MNDTPRNILLKQFEIMNSKTLKEKFECLFELTDLSRTIIQNRIKERNPDISEIELKVELFKTFYRFDFDEVTLNEIANHIRQNHIFNQNHSE